MRYLVRWGHNDVLEGGQTCNSEDGVLSMLEWDTDLSEERIEHLLQHGYVGDPEQWIQVLGIPHR
jgi:hypothetical protein